MEINNVNNLSITRTIGGIKDAYNTLQKNDISTAGAEKTGKTDTFSGGIYSSGSELEPRVELLNSILDNIQSGIYNSQETIGKIAEKLVLQGFSGLQDTTELSNSLNVAEQREKIETNYYSDSSVINSTAKKLVDSLGTDLLA